MCVILRFWLNIVEPICLQGKAIRDKRILLRCLQGYGIHCTLTELHRTRVVCLAVRGYPLPLRSLPLYYWILV